MKQKVYTLPVSSGMANALRRALIMDIDAWAPNEIEFEKNSSCQTDEYIAHRIGLIPFVKIGNGETMKISVKGRTLWASDLTGPSFEVVNDTEIIEMTEEQEIIATVHFAFKKGSTHARYKMCSGVGMKKINDDTHQISFETINDEDPDAVIKKAISELKNKVEKALFDVGKITTNV